MYLSPVSLCLSGAGAGLILLMILFLSGATIVPSPSEGQFASVQRENEIRQQVVEETAKQIAAVLVQRDRSTWCQPAPQNWNSEKEPIGILYLHNALEKICR